MSELQTFRSLAPSLKAGAAGTCFLQHERRFFTRHRCLRPLLCPRPGLWPPSRLRPPAPSSLAGWEALAWTQLQNRREGREGKHLCSLLTRKPPDGALPRTGAPTRATGPPRWSSECECVIGHSQTSLGTPVTPPRDGRRSRPVSVQSQQSRGDPAPDGARRGSGPRPFPPPPSLSPGPLVWSHLSKHSGSYAVVCARCGSLRAAGSSDPAEVTGQQPGLPMRGRSQRVGTPRGGRQGRARPAPACRPCAPTAGRLGRPSRNFSALPVSHLKPRALSQSVPAVPRTWGRAGRLRQKPASPAPRPRGGASAASRGPLHSWHQPEKCLLPQPCVWETGRVWQGAASTWEVSSLGTLLAYLLEGLWLKGRGQQVSESAAKSRTAQGAPGGLQRPCGACVGLRWRSTRRPGLCDGVRGGVQPPSCWGQRPFQLAPAALSPPRGSASPRLIPSSLRSAFQKTLFLAAP